MSEENKALARRFLDALWNREDFTVVDDLVASDYDGHSSTEIHGPDGAKEFVPTLREAFPDFEFTVADQIGEGDRVVTRWTAHGTHKGEFQGIPATGRGVAISGITIFRIANGKLVEGWTSEDMLGFLRQLGAIAAPADN